MGQFDLTARSRHGCPGADGVHGWLATVLIQLNRRRAALPELATNFPLMPLQYRVIYRAVCHGVFTAGDGNDTTWNVRNAHLSDRA